MFYYLKNIIILLGFFLIANTGFSQSNLGANKSSYEQQETYIGWTLSNNGCNGCASFYWKVTRTWQYGGYRYDMWFSSNSAYPNGQHCSTSLSGIYIYVNGQLVYDEPAWLMFDGAYSNQVTSFVTSIPNPIITFTWQSATIF